jgi:hypothetical protein
VVEVSRRIAAPADVVFGVLADPRRHAELDGSGMVRGVVSAGAIADVGDTFVMQMHYSALGDYEMINHVVEFEPDRRIAWEPEAGRNHPDAGQPHSRWGQRWGYTLEPDGAAATVVTETYDCSSIPEQERATMDDGRAWIPEMTATLERLARICEV